VLNTPSGQAPVTFAPSLRNPLPRSTDDPNQVELYVPVSRPAGYRAAGAAFTTIPAGVTVPFTLDLTESAVAGSYQAIFGNELVVDRDSLVSTGTSVGSTVTIRRRRVVLDPPGARDSVIEAYPFAYPPPNVFPVAGAPTSTVGATIGDTVRTTVRYTATSFVLVGPDGPVFGSRQLTGAEATPTAVIAGPAFPGFTISADNSLATAFDAEGERQVLGPGSASQPGADQQDTIVDRVLVDRSMVQWQEDVAFRPVAADGTGRYEVAWLADPFGLEQGLLLNRTDPVATATTLLAAIEDRAVAATGLTDSATAALLNVRQTELVPLRLPFTIRNRTFDRPVAVAALRRRADTLVVGAGTDTVSVTIPGDAWVPGDALVFIEDIREDSLVPSNVLVLDTLGQPIQRMRRAVSFGRAVLGCSTPRTSCNPLADGSPGATGYTPMHAGDRTEFAYFAGFRETGRYTFDVRGAVTGVAITAVTDSALRLIRVVPNPFVLYSAYQTSVEQPRLLFTNMPPTGTLRVYTVAGQFVQQITWGSDDLEGDGDLYWDLNTRGGLEVASGLYLWSLTAPSDPGDPSSTALQARGKFVIVR